MYLERFLYFYDYDIITEKLTGYIFCQSG